MSHTGGINVAGFAALNRNIKPLPSTIDILNGRKPVITTPRLRLLLPSVNSLAILVAG
jgi:hypothetical protein